MKDEKTRVEETTETKEEKGFTAYLEIYGSSRMLAKVFREFIGDPDMLGEDDMFDIATQLENLSGIDEEVISHSVLKIVPDSENEDDSEE